MTGQEMQTFKELFSKYCRQEINKGHCEADSCDICSINNAYEEIFDRFADTEDEYEHPEIDGDSGLVRALLYIEEAPIVTDAVLVIRCKNCKLRFTAKCPMPTAENGDGFCSRGVAVR